MPFLVADIIPSVGADEVTMLAVAAVMAAGMAAGLLYKAGAALALSFVAFAVTLVMTLGQGWPFWSGVLAAFGLMILLQVSYLAGVAFAIAFQRAKAAQGVRSTLSALFKRAD